MSKEDREVLDMANGVHENAMEEKKVCTKGVGSSMPQWKRPGFQQMLSEVSGWTGFGAVMLTCMLVGVAPMWLAAPVFTGCFAWVAIRVDRHFRR